MNAKLIQHLTTGPEQVDCASQCRGINHIIVNSSIHNILGRVWCRAGMAAQIQKGAESQYVYSFSPVGDGAILQPRTSVDCVTER